MIPRPLADVAPVGLFAMAADGRLTSVNAAFLGMAGRPADDIVGARLRTLLTQSSQILYALKVESQLLANGQVQEVLLELRRGEAGGLPVLITVERDREDHEAYYGVLFPAPERRAYELELIGARQAAIAMTEARDLLLREVYHRVKNNLQMVDSLLMMQSRRLRDPDAVAALKTMRQRVFALGLVHHQLMGSKDLRTFDIAAFLQELADHLRTAGGGDVQIQVSAAPVPAGLDFAIPLGLIVTELTTNALKHAFPDGRGVIEISLQDGDGDAVLLRVADDGVGVEADDRQAEPSLGIDIVRGLVGQMGGRLNVAAGAGTTYEIRLPAPRPL